MDGWICVAEAATLSCKFRRGSTIKEPAEKLLSVLTKAEVIQRLTIGIRPLRIFHVGAHLAEEQATYAPIGASEVHWVEARPDLVAKLRDELDSSAHRVYEGAAWSETGIEKTFRVTKNSQSSSSYPRHLHLQSHPEVKEESQQAITTTRLDDLLPRLSFPLVVMDIQGAELEALKGMGRLLGGTRVIYLEVNKKEIYKGIELVGDLDNWLNKIGFSRVITSWEAGRGWGDAIYTRQISALTKFKGKREHKKSLGS